MELRLLRCLLIVLSLGAANGRHLSTNGTDIRDEEEPQTSGLFLDLKKDNSTQEDEIILGINMLRNEWPKGNFYLDGANAFCAIRAKRITELRNAIASGISDYSEGDTEADNSIASRKKRSTGLDDAGADGSYIDAPLKFSLNEALNSSEEVDLENLIIASAAAERYCASRAAGNATLEEFNVLWDEVNRNITTRATNGSSVLLNTFYGTRGKRSVELEDEVEDNTLHEETHESVPSPVEIFITLVDDDEEDSSLEETEYGWEKDGWYALTDEESNMILVNEIEEDRSHQEADAHILDTTSRISKTLLEPMGVAHILVNAFIGSRGKRSRESEDMETFDLSPGENEKFSSNHSFATDESDTYFATRVKRDVGLWEYITPSSEGPKNPGAFLGLRGKRNAELDDEVQHDSSPEETERYIPTYTKRNAELDDEAQHDPSPEETERYIPTYTKRNAEFSDMVETNSSPEGVERYIPTYANSNAALNYKVEDTGISLKEVNNYNSNCRRCNLVLQLLGIQGDDNILTAVAQKSSIRRKRIAGGIDANEKEFPYQVSLRFDGLHICGGALISKQHVLTAAHCICGIIDESYDDLTVVTGSVRIDKGGESHGVKNVHCHKDFVFGLVHSWQSDIAVVTLNDTVSFNDAQSSAKLPFSDPTVRQHAVITGWGKSKEQGYLHKNLQKLAVNIISHEECQGYYNNTILSSQLCSFNGQGSGACKGDSGSPLASNGTIIGVFSWTNPCAHGSPEVFTNVRYFSDFIQRSMKAPDSINPITDQEKIGVNVRVSNGTGDSVGNNADYLTLIDRGTAAVSLV